MKLKASVLLAALLGAGAAASDAHACLSFDDVQVRPARVHPKAAPVAASERIAGAVQRLEEEKLAEACTEVAVAFPDIRHAAVGASPLETRALRVLALAVVRGNGALTGVRGFATEGAAERTANLDWATYVLRSVSAERRDDPVALADLGEALAASPGKDEEALRILADLAQRDLMGSAHAYAALARLRASHGDSDGSRGALARCELMTRSPGAVCRSPDGRLAVRD
jgi:hypothetical protein